MKRGLTPAPFSALKSGEVGDWLAAFAVFRASAGVVSGEAPPLRPALAPSAGLRRAATAARAAEIADDREALAFFGEHFQAWRVGAAGGGFLTGYYEPVVRGSLARSPAFPSPISKRPADLETRRPYPARADIDDAGGEAVVWLEDEVEVFYIQVQGSGRVRLPDGRELRLVYDGRNGRPYTSIGRLAIERGFIPQAEMSLARLKSFLREDGARGRALMRENESYIFFRAEPAPIADTGPTGGAGLPLTRLRSIAVDRGVWPYGTPFFIEAKLPWRGAEPEKFARPLIALDTGSAIKGAARADLYFGSGDQAGARAGDIRHVADFVALLPIGEDPDVAA